MNCQKTSSDILEQLRQSQLLSSASGSVVKKVAQIVESTSLRAGETLFNKGEVGNAMYIITKGRVRVHDSDLTLNHLGASAVVGEMAALAEQEVRSASITADQDTSLLRLRRDALYELLSREPEVAKALIHVLCQREKSIIYDVTRRSREVRTLENELQIGRQIQAGFLPETLPQVPGWDIAAFFQAAREVGGDFYDAFFITERGEIALVVGDVCDKGVGAALFMTLFRSLVRASLISEDLVNTKNTGTDSGNNSYSGVRRGSSFLLQNAVTLVNNYVSRNHSKSSMFATLFLGLLNPATGELTFVNCGHEAPVILNNGEIKTRLNPTGPVVGMFTGASYGVERMYLEPNDFLFAFTDGVTEAVNLASEQFGEKRLLPVLAEPAESAEEMIAKVILNLVRFSQDVSQFDDITILVVKHIQNGVEDSL